MIRSTLRVVLLWALYRPSSQSCAGLQTALKQRCAKCLFLEKLDNVKAPPYLSRKWCNSTKIHSLALVLIEPRAHALLEPIVWNFAHAYGGQQNVSLWIFHGSLNAVAVRLMFGSWKNVNLIRMHVDNFINGPAYSRYLLSNTFWEYFVSPEHVLIFHTDSALFRPISREMFQYDYLGAPWPHHPCTQLGACADVGNGGLTLRRVSAMREVIKAWEPSDAPEDVIFGANVRNAAPREVAMNFSAEMIFSPNTDGVHQPWTSLEFEQVKALLDKPFLGEGSC